MDEAIKHDLRNLNANRVDAQNGLYGERLFVEVDRRTWVTFKNGVTWMYMPANFATICLDN